MSEADLTVTLGIEEEFFLVDPETRDLVSDPDPDIFEACARRRGPHKVVHEVIRSQIETSTKVCGSVAEAGEALRETRRLVVQSAAQRGGDGRIEPSLHRMAVAAHHAPGTLRALGRHLSGEHAADARRRHARPRRLRRSRCAHPGHDRAPALPAAGACAVDVVAVPRRPRDRVQVLPVEHHGRDAAHQHARSAAVAGGLRPHRGCLPADGVYRERQRAVVGRAAVTRVSDGGDADLRRLPASGRRDQHRGALRLADPAAPATGWPRRAAARSAHGDHRRESLARPALRCARFSRQRLGRVADGWTSKTTPPDSSRIWRTTPASSAAKTSCGTCSPSSATAAAPTGSSTTSASVGWRAIRRTRRCTAWSTW